MNKDENLSIEASVQSIVYHSKVENNGNYLKILRGLQVLAIEKSSFHIDNVISDIDTNGNST